MPHGSSQVAPVAMGAAGRAALTAKALSHAAKANAALAGLTSWRVRFPNHGADTPATRDPPMAALRRTCDTAPALSMAAVVGEYASCQREGAEVESYHVEEVVGPNACLAAG